MKRGLQRTSKKFAPRLRAARDDGQLLRPVPIWLASTAARVVEKLDVKRLLQSFVPRVHDARVWPSTIRWFFDSTLALLLCAAERPHIWFFACEMRVDFMAFKAVLARGLLLEMLLKRIDSQGLPCHAH